MSLLTSVLDLMGGWIVARDRMALQSASHAFCFKSPLTLPEQLLMWTRRAVALQPMKQAFPLTKKALLSAELYIQDLEHSMRTNRARPRARRAA
jgi:hypothetical protein